MNFSELKTELAARGFDYLSDTRRGQYINWARAELDESALWPYRLTTATGGPSSLAISDLGPIESVADTSNSYVSLTLMQRGDLVDRYGDITTTGNPEFFYVDGSTIRTYPSGGSFSVRYYKIPPDLTGTDTPLAPTRFHRLIVDLAVERAYRDNDNHQAAEQLRVAIERDLVTMRWALGQITSLDYVDTEAADW